jgi:predicted HNH restriction endonuclease
MAQIDRNNLQDAQRIVQKFLPNEQARKKFINFLGNAITFSNSIKPNNWMLNLNKNGQFLRFNIGREYCITLRKDTLLILCDRTTIKSVVEKENIPVIYHYDSSKKGEKAINNIDIDKVPDAVVLTKNSIGCVLKNEYIERYIDFFSQSNKDFIKSAMNTYLLPQYRVAHSLGAVEYIFSEFEEKTNIELQQIFEEKLRQAKKLNNKELQEKIDNAKTIKAVKTTIQQSVYDRNPYVVEFVLRRANGKCEKCKQPAPFLRDKDNTPFLEVHHIVSLSEDGNDTIENTIGLCPNCHRHAHYGKKTFKNK